MKMFQEQIALNKCKITVNIYKCYQRNLKTHKYAES